VTAPSPRATALLFHVEQHQRTDPFHVKLSLRDWTA
jgi:hypothetical protein